MENAASELDPAETQEVIRIATEYFRSVSSSEEEAQKLLEAMAGMIQEQGAKLVHLGNVLFLVIVRGAGLVEVHTIGNESRPRDMAKNFVDLANYLKGIGVKAAYTYSEDNKFEKLAKMVNLDIKQFPIEVQGVKMNAYLVEM